jgi:hypothetical protein
VCVQQLGRQGTQNLGPLDANNGLDLIEYDELTLQDLSIDGQLVACARGPSLPTSARPSRGIRFEQGVLLEDHVWGGSWLARYLRREAAVAGGSTSAQGHDDQCAEQLSHVSAVVTGASCSRMRPSRGRFSSMPICSRLQRSFTA